jgi:hypothetical protein
VTTSMITPPFNISARPVLTRNVARSAIASHITGAAERPDVRPSHERRANRSDPTIGGLGGLAGASLGTAEWFQPAQRAPHHTRRRRVLGAGEAASTALPPRYLSL